MNSAQDELRRDENLAKALSVSKDFFIFPCKVDKSPYTPHGFKDATQDEAQIRQWWRSWPKALVGVPTGSTNGLVVIDYDPDKGSGTAKEWIQNHSEALISTRVNDTRRQGGKHYIYNTAHAYQSGSDVVLDGIKRHGLDIRAEGGYVIWWTAEGKHTEGDIQPLPAGLLDERLKTNHTAPMPQTGSPMLISASDWSRDRERVIAELPFIDAADRGNWVKVGQAIHLATSGSEDGVSIWHRWSASGDAGPPAGYESESDCRYHWSSFNQGINGKEKLVTLGTVFDLARKGGWQKGSGELELKTQRSGEAELNPIRIRSAAEIVKDRTQPRYKLLTSADLHALPPLSWRIRGALPAEGLAAIFGPSGSGKSFLALDMAAAIASGREWFALRVTAAPVVYCMLEGEAGLPVRVAAWESRNDAVMKVRVLVQQPFKLTEPQDVQDLAAAVLGAGGGAVTFIDTLNRAAPTADENSSRDMGSIIEAAKDLQRATGGLVVLVHHTGKDVSKGLRGHSSLFAALDAAIEVSRSMDRHEWTLTKSKDGADGVVNAFTLSTVFLGPDADGEPLSSCAVVRDGSAAEVRRTKLPQGKNQLIVWDVLKPLFKDATMGKPGAPPYAKCIELEAAIASASGRLTCLHERRAERAREAITGLVSHGLLGCNDGWIWATK